MEECGRSWDFEGFAGSFSFSDVFDFFAMNSSLAFSALLGRMCSYCGNIVLLYNLFFRDFTERVNVHA